MLAENTLTNTANIAKITNLTRIDKSTCMRADHSVL